MGYVLVFSLSYISSDRASLNYVYFCKINVKSIAKFDFEEISSNLDILNCNDRKTVLNCSF